MKPEIQPAHSGGVKMAAKTKKRSAKPNAKAAGGITPKKASKEELLHYYREMLMIRRFEEKAGQLYGMGLIGGFCHLYIGQEAVVVGMQATIDDRDAVITGNRNPGKRLPYG